MGCIDKARQKRKQSPFLPRTGQPSKLLLGDSQVAAMGWHVRGQDSEWRDHLWHGMDQRARSAIRRLSITGTGFDAKYFIIPLVGWCEISSLGEYYGWAWSWPPPVIAFITTETGRILVP